MPHRIGTADLRVPLTAVTQAPAHHFFGYYEKTPWSPDGRYLLAHRTDFAGRDPEPGERATIGMIDIEDGYRFIELDTTSEWSWQQGSMLQWLGSAAGESGNRIIYNRVPDEGGRPTAIIRDVDSGETQPLDDSIYAVTPDGSQAVTLDFHRLQWLRPGYGYASARPTEHRDPAPTDSGISHIDLATGEPTLLLSIRDIAHHDPISERHDCPHWVNHLQINTDGTWFSFLHRWNPTDDAYRRTGLRTRLMACRLDGSDLHSLCDTRSFSHYDWRDPSTILGWANAPLPESSLARNTDPEPEKHFYYFTVHGEQSAPVAPDTMLVDGHCSYSPTSTPDGGRVWVLNDTYEDKEWMRTLYLWNESTGERHDLGRFLGQPKSWPREARCDLHPRWNRDGTQVCIDSAHTSTRQMYTLDVSAFTAV